MFERLNRDGSDTSVTTGDAIIVNLFKFGVCCTFLLYRYETCEWWRLRGGEGEGTGQRTETSVCNESRGKRWKEDFKMRDRGRKSGEGLFIE